MRKPILIEKTKCGPLWWTVIRAARTLPLREHFREYREGIVGLTGKVKELVKAVTTEADSADKELGFGPESAEAAGREYLRSLVSGGGDPECRL